MEKEIIFEYLLAAVLIIIPLILIYFEFLDSKKIKKRKAAPKGNKKYIDRIHEVRVKEPNTALDDIDIIARDFFMDLFKIEKFPGYSSIKKEFEKKSKKNEALFCKIMDDFLYERDKPSKKQIKELLDVFGKIIIRNEIKEETKDNKKDKNQNKNTKKSAKSS